MLGLNILSDYHIQADWNWEDGKISISRTLSDIPFVCLCPVIADKCFL